MTVGACCYSLPCNLSFLPAATDSDPSASRLFLKEPPAVPIFRDVVICLRLPSSTRRSVRNSTSTCVTTNDKRTATVQSSSTFRLSAFRSRQQQWKLLQSVDQLRHPHTPSARRHSSLPVASSAAIDKSYLGPRTQQQASLSLEGEQKAIAPRPLPRLSATLHNGLWLSSSPNLQHTSPTPRVYRLEPPSLPQGDSIQYVVDIEALR